MKKKSGCPNCKAKNQNGNYCSECGYGIKSNISSLAGTIDIGGDERLCEMKYCPFHAWAKIMNPKGPGDSICNLPGEGGDVLFSANFDGEYRRKPKDLQYAGTERLPKCFKTKPLSDDFIKKHPELNLTKEYIGQEYKWKAWK
jgi:hypothetical protein